MTNALFDNETDRRIWNQEAAILEATELICQLMEQNDISRKELADRLKKTKGYVTQLLDGSTNMTLRTLSDVLTALGHVLHIQAHKMPLPSAKTVEVEVSFPNEAAGDRIGQFYQQFTS